MIYVYSAMSHPQTSADGLRAETSEVHTTPGAERTVNSLQTR